jgi:spore maturation protein SpmA
MYGILQNTTVNQLFALNISTSIINYTALEPNQFSPNITVNISNVGNMPMNISVYGFGGDNEATGTGLSMVCEINNISIAFEKFATNSTAN